MPWHAPQTTPLGLTSEVATTWSIFDHDGARSVNVPVRREALKSLGTRERTAHLSATWSKQDASAVRRIFDRFDNRKSEEEEAAMGEEELTSALKLMKLPVDAEQASKLVSEFDKNRSGKLELGEFRTLVAEQRRAQREAPPPPAAAPPSPPKPRHAMSGDDGGLPDGATSPGSARTLGSFGSPSADAGVLGADGMALNESAIELEVAHVRRQLLGRAFRQQSTVQAVVHEHQVYHEGLRRALDGQDAAWQLHLLHNRDIAKARGVARSHWRPATAGPGNRSHKQQINVNPYAGPDGADPTVKIRKAKPREYTRMSDEAINKWVAKVDNLQRKVSAKGS